MQITLEQLGEIFPGLDRENGELDEWHFFLSEILPRYSIDTPKRIAAFLAQCGHESMGFTVLEENLNYSALGLRNTFGKYFPNARTAEKYARKPRAIASRVYANRMGNGDEASQDGWKYRGRGIIQLTGYDNYKAVSEALYQDDRLVNTPGLIAADIAIAIEVACWYWKKNKLNTYADKEDLRGMTRKINGGYNGLEDRVDKYRKAIQILES